MRHIFFIALVLLAVNVCSAQNRYSYSDRSGTQQGSVYQSRNGTSYIYDRYGRNIGYINRQGYVADRSGTIQGRIVPYYNGYRGYNPYAVPTWYYYQNR